MIRFQGAMIAPGALVPEGSRINRPIGRSPRFLPGRKRERFKTLPHGGHGAGTGELSRLKAPDVELEPDLLRRTWRATDWSDHADVPGRVLPQFARVLVAGQAEHLFGLEEAGYSFARGRWEQ